MARSYGFDFIWYGLTVRSETEIVGSTRNPLWCFLITAFSDKYSPGISAKKETKHFLTRYFTLHAKSFSQQNWLTTEHFHLSI